MGLTKEPFKDYTLDEDKAPDRDRTLRVRMNDQQYKALRRDMKVLQQAKESTAIKEMLEIARIVLHAESTGAILRFRLNNIRRNKRTGAGYDLQT